MQVADVEGVVTQRVARRGFFLQAQGDGDPWTSDALFVFHGAQNQDAIRVGDLVKVSGKVEEYRQTIDAEHPDNLENNVLAQTQINASRGSIAVVAREQPLPPYFDIESRPPPDSFVSGNAMGYDPRWNALDYYESLEGMRVRVGGTGMPAFAVDGVTRFDTLPVVHGALWKTSNIDRGIWADEQQQAWWNGDLRGSMLAVFDLPFPFNRAANSGLFDPNFLANRADGNPEVLWLTDYFNPGLLPSRARDGSAITSGTELRDVTGVLDYVFGQFRVQLDRAPTMGAQRADWSAFATHRREMQQRDATTTRIATYNVQYLDSNDGDGDADIRDGKFQRIAAHLREMDLPEVILLQEIGDDNGHSRVDGPASAQQTVERLLREINTCVFDNCPQFAAHYIEPASDFGGTLRNVTLFDTRTVRASLQAGGGPFQRLGDRPLVQVEHTATGPALTHNPAWIDPAHPAWQCGRPPLVSQLESVAQNKTTRTLLVVNVHLQSRIGSSPLMGSDQPPMAMGEASSLGCAGSGDLPWGRVQQAGQVGAWTGHFIDMAIESKKNDAVVVGGDFNDYYWSNALAIASRNLAGEPQLTNAIPSISPPLRFTHRYDHNQLAFDHLLVSNRFAEGMRAGILHVNTITDPAGKLAPASDHNPAYVDLQLGW